MIGFVYKDFWVMRKQLSYYLLFFGVYGILTVSGVFGPSILTAMLVVVAMMIPMATMSYDDLAHWDKYAAATPAGRNGIVAGKYLFTVLCILGSAAVVVVLEVIMAFTGLITVSLGEQVVVMAACMGAALVIDAIMLPILMRFGAEKSRIISMIFFVAIFGGGMLLLQFIEAKGTLPVPPAWLLSALPVVLTLVAVGSFVISYFISLGIMAKKEL